MTKNLGPRRCARQSRWLHLLPGHPLDTLVDRRVEFDALIADNAFDSDAIIAESNQDRNFSTSTPLKPACHRY
jgi:hypothetical protein